MDKSAKLMFYPISDVHGGSRHIREDKLNRTIAVIQENDDAYWFGLGDLGDWICFSDRRFDYYEMADWIDLADPWMSTLDWLEDKLKPIAPKCLGLIKGNHEVTVAQKYQMHVHKHLCARLGVIDLGPSCMYRIVCHYRSANTTTKLDFHLIHGWGGGRTSGARTNKLEQLMRDNAADVYIMGHVHGALPVLKSTIRGMNSRGRLTYRDRLGVIAGTYLLDAEYERRNGYPPSVVGSPEITFHAWSRELEGRI